MLSSGEPAEAKSPRWRYRLTTTPGNGARTLVYARSFSAASSARRACSDRLLLDLDQQLDLADLVVADLGEVDALGRLLFRLLRGVQRAAGDVDLGPRGQGLGQPSLGEVHLRGGRVAGLCDLLLAAAAGWPPAARAG